jgi:hypothetical protein
VELFGVALLVIALLLVLAAAQLGGEPSQLFSGMWGYRAPGWPHGVQEDDDARWGWVRPAPEDPADATQVTPERLRPTLRRGRSQ